VIRHNDNVLSVDADVSNYIIEPARFDLGLSRVEMVDDHLKRLAADGKSHGRDSDYLLEARAAFLFEEQHPEVTT
jgi:hypothetical protein